MSKLKEALKEIERLKELAFKDRLTGCFSHAWYREFIGSELPAEYAGLLFVDINDLTSVNNSYGHQAGNELICGVAKGLLEAEAGEVIRWGGDEFILLVRTNANFAELSSTLKSLSISYGFSKKRDSSEALAEADLFMYEHKALQKAKR